jgi:dihydropteroate synthase
VAACAEAGIAADRLLVDPGFGFGKTDEQNLTLLATLGRIGDLGRPVLVGLSRKGTLGNVVGRAANERMPAGLAAAVIAVERGAQIVRTHDVQDTVDALKIVKAVNQAEQR